MEIKKYQLLCKFCDKLFKNNKFNQINKFIPLLHVVRPHPKDMHDYRNILSEEFNYNLGHYEKIITAAEVTNISITDDVADEITVTAGGARALAIPNPTTTAVSNAPVPPTTFASVLQLSLCLAAHSIFSSSNSSTANNAALQFKVSKTVSIRKRSTPPSYNPLACS